MTPHNKIPSETAKTISDGISRLVDQGWRVADACKQYGISYSTYARWRRTRGYGTRRWFGPLTKDNIGSVVKVIPSTGCWNWQRTIGDSGYGKVWNGTKVITAHRASYEIHKGPIGDKCVLHRCDNRQCVNPDHLFLGTLKDNTQDAIAKGRLKIGSNHPNAKMSENDVKDAMEARKSGEPVSSIAKRYGTSVSSIYNLLSGKTYRHIATKTPPQRQSDVAA